MIINRVWAMPSAWTFTIKPIKELLSRYVDDGIGWIDPFAGKNSPARFRNDLNKEYDAEYHYDAIEFCELLHACKDYSDFKGVLFDPPYSYRQISEHYKAIGRKATRLDTSANFYSKIKDSLAPLIPTGGYAISFGWNSNGFGKKRGFEIEEILLVAHGVQHNDTIVTVEKKIK